MTNHYLLITPVRKDALSFIMQPVGRRYVRCVNKGYGRSGTLWEGRFKTNLIQSEDCLLGCYRYIELNPTRAGMVEHPGEYRWSSYAANAQGEGDPVLTAHHEYLRLGRSPVERQEVYRALFLQQVDPVVIDEIRSATKLELVVGASRFRDAIAVMTKRRARLGHPGRPKQGAEQEY